MVYICGVTQMVLECILGTWGSNAHQYMTLYYTWHHQAPVLLAIYDEIDVVGGGGGPEKCLLEFFGLMSRIFFFA